MSVAQTDSYTGKKVELVTKAQVRYEGTVVKLDKVERAMHLANVKSYGTEGRKNGQGEIPPRDDIIEMVVFKIELVQNFEVIQDSKPTQYQQQQDPAVVQTPSAAPKEEIKQDKQAKVVQKYQPKHPYANEPQDYADRTLQKYQVKENTPVPAQVKEAQPTQEAVAKDQDSEEDESAGFFDTITNSTVVKEERPRGGRGRGGRGGYRGGQDGQEGGYHGNRGGNRGGYRTNNNYDQDGQQQRGGYHQRRGDNESRGGYRDHRDQGGYQNQRGSADRGGYRGPPRDNWRSKDNETFGYQQESDGFQRRGGYQQQRGGRGGNQQYNNKPQYQNYRQQRDRDNETFQTQQDDRQSMQKMEDPNKVGQQQTTDGFEQQQHRKQGGYQNKQQLNQQRGGGYRGGYRNQGGPQGGYEPKKRGERVGDLNGKEDRQIGATPQQEESKAD